MKKLKVKGVNIDANAQTILALGLVGAGLLWWGERTAKKVVQAAGDGAVAVGEAVNPVSQDNIFNKGFEALYGVFRPGKTLGGDIYEWTHKDGE